MEFVITAINFVLKLSHRNKQIEKLTATEEARLMAYILVPTLIIFSLISAFYFGWLGIDLDKPVAISQLHTEFSTEGVTVTKRGAVLIAEPISSDYKIPVANNEARVWSSLSKKDWDSNKDSLRLDGADLGIDTAFYGVGEPVAIFVEGDLGNEIKLRGKAKAVADYPLTSKRSVSLVFWVMTICFLAYGMAVARGAPIVSPKKGKAGKKGTKPNKK